MTISRKWKTSERTSMNCTTIGLSNSWRKSRRDVVRMSSLRSNSTIAGTGRLSLKELIRVMPIKKVKMESLTSHRRLLSMMLRSKSD